jgi:hypothetical protein
MAAQKGSILAGGTSISASSWGEFTQNTLEQSRVCLCFARRSEPLTGEDRSATISQQGEAPTWPVQMDGHQYHLPNFPVRGFVRLR